MPAGIHDFKLDLSHNRLLFPEGNRAVRPKTLTLLLYFIEHANEVLSKQQLLDEVWKSAGAQEHLLFQSVKRSESYSHQIMLSKPIPKPGING